MKRFFYIKLVLILMLMGVWESVWAGSYVSGTIANFNFTVTNPNTCTSFPVTVSNAIIELVSKTRVRLRCTITYLSGPVSYDQTINNGGTFPNFSGNAYCINDISSRQTYFRPAIQYTYTRSGSIICQFGVGTTESSFGSGSGSITTSLSFQGAFSEITRYNNNTTACSNQFLSGRGFFRGSTYGIWQLYMISPSGEKISMGYSTANNPSSFDFFEDFPSFRVSDFFSNLPDNSIITLLLEATGLADKSVTIRVYRPLDPIISTSKDFSCYGNDVITLNCDNSIFSSIFPLDATNYNWSTGESNASRIFVKPSSKTNYTVTTSRGSENVCSQTSSSKTIDFFPIFTPTITSSSNDACKDAGIILTASPNIDATYTWNNGGNRNSIQVNQAGDYIVTVKPNNGCQERKSDGVFGSNLVFYKPIEGEKIELSKSDGVICENGDKNISLTARATDEASLTGYLWLGNNGNNQKISVSNAGDYTVIMSRGKCTKQITQKITKFEFPATITTPAKSVCNDGTTFKAETSISNADALQYKFEWSDATGVLAALGDKNFATITKAGEYQVKITPPFSCPFKLSNKVQYNFDPPFTDVDIRYPGAKTKPVICGAPEEPSIVLTAFAKDLSDVKYSWNGPNNAPLGTTDKITVLDANAGEYKLSLSHVSGTCPTSKTISVVGSFTPQINTVTPTDGRICNEKGNIVKLTATPSNATDYIYQWLGGTDGKTDLKQTTNTLSTTQTGVYALSMTQLGGNCTPKIAVKTIAVTVDEPILNAKISPDSAVICNPTSGLSLVASADGTGISYQWTGASSTSQTLVVKKQGDYFVTYTRGKCVIPNKKITAVESKLIVKLTPETATSNKPFVICTSTTNGVAFPLQASTNISSSSLKWYLTGSTDVIDTNKIYNPKKTGDYYAVATNTKFGCTSDPSNKVSITVFDNFSVNIDPLNPKQLCEGSVQKFTAISINQNFDYSYVWSLDGNAITPSNTNFIDVRKEGNYTVAITKDGCKASSVVSKISTKPSRPIITVLDNAYLESTENVDGATAFQWYYKKANPISENDTLVSSYNLLADNTKRITVRIDEGTYMVKSNRNGCGKRFSNAIYLTKPLGMDFLDKNEWKVYPNPTTESINIENNSAIPDKAQVDLWSSTGTLISSWTQSGKTSSYNFLNLPVGTYLITISQKEKSLTTKLIKQ